MMRVVDVVTLCVLASLTLAHPHLVKREATGPDTPDNGIETPHKLARPATDETVENADVTSVRGPEQELQPKPEKTPTLRPGMLQSLKLPTIKVPPTSDAGLDLKDVGLDLKDVGLDIKDAGLDLKDKLFPTETSEVPPTVSGESNTDPETPPTVPVKVTKEKKENLSKRPPIMSLGGPGALKGAMPQMMPLGGPGAMKGAMPPMMPFGRPGAMKGAMPPMMPMRGPGAMKGGMPQMMSMRGSGAMPPMMPMRGSGAMPPMMPMRRSGAMPPMMPMRGSGAMPPMMPGAMKGAMPPMMPVGGQRGLPGVPPLGMTGIHPMSSAMKGENATLPAMPPPQQLMMMELARRQRMLQRNLQRLRAREQEQRMSRQDGTDTPATGEDNPSKPNDINRQEDKQRLRVARLRLRMRMEREMQMRAMLAAQHLHQQQQHMMTSGVQQQQPHMMTAGGVQFAGQVGSVGSGPAMSGRGEALSSFLERIKGTQGGAPKNMPLQDPRIQSIQNTHPGLQGPMNPGMPQLPMMQHDPRMHHQMMATMMQDPRMQMMPGMKDPRMQGLPGLQDMKLRQTMMNTPQMPPVPAMYGPHSVGPNLPGMQTAGPIHPMAAMQDPRLMNHFPPMQHPSLAHPFAPTPHPGMNPYHSTMQDPRLMNHFPPMQHPSLAHPFAPTPHPGMNPYHSTMQDMPERPETIPFGMETERPLKTEPFMPDIQGPKDSWDMAMPQPEYQDERINREIEGLSRMFNSHRGPIVVPVPSLRHVMGLESRLEDIRQVLIRSFYSDLNKFQQLSQHFKAKLTAKLTLLRQIEAELAMPMRSALAAAGTTPHFDLQPQTDGLEAPPPGHASLIMRAVGLRRT